jgi:hypothetical protein
VPTPNGEIFVRAERTKNGLTVVIDLPAEVEDCTLFWPDGYSEKITVSGTYQR